ncbi:MAG: zinc ribbon domain-containing protein [Anaerolineales bacterium]|nr:zinc ribbon domain-containing protein [Anaerolineales bacterium]
MPIFEFECNQCHTDFEELVRNSEAAGKVKCPNCGGHKVRKKLSTFTARATGSSRSSGTASAAACAPGGT